MLKIKDTHKDTVIGFNNSGVPLGKRSQADLLDLAIMGHKSSHKLILDAFEDLPSLEELQKQKLGTVEKQVAAKTKGANPEKVNNGRKENIRAKENNAQE